MKTIDNPENISSDKRKILEKYFLKQIYLNFYSQLNPKRIPEGPIIELGSGGGFTKDVIGNLTTSDIIKGPGIDKVFSATKIPYKDSSISAYIMLDVFHHIKDPQKALYEMERTLKSKGKIIMIEPWNSLWGKFVYKYLHHEHYDPKTKNWKTSGRGRMSDSNTALPWIIFYRDKEKLNDIFPGLKLISIRLHTPFLYLLSGGLKLPQLLPSFLYNPIRIIDNLISTQVPQISMFATITLQKK
ncbi:MAG: type 11 methyltransferase [Candidatus Woesebacteria bacterium GW2011_GWB1_43_14]|uniref:Type 11 methyltransferase n=1 Tax=Candidatus Woesebacteria bacterium GW2011_GWB1_43_14 TaxID=1618578 RepID=A0A0G1DH86_9BACT|nr:MAG: type 11 methyltransferase [Candidatus Woesebacteria bacterium GW2011_GWA1_39_11b]KKS78362.1 MAG: type 11 methyltransferase [Candidatus Woesebacteria bacterium GW2011_GWC1_42_9]KKS97220.1 MAG: type 11 methyltransferase [Candidatus Woesebacteria bacterium GW2011_GWB1_43_14]